MWRLSLGLLLLLLTGCSSLSVYENSENAFGQNDLMRAVYYRDLDTFKVEAKNTENLYEKDKTGANIYHYIARYGTTEMAEYILKHDTHALLEQKGGNRETTPLQEALLEKNVHVAELLYSFTSDESVFQVDKFGRSSLHFAYVVSADEIVTDLLEKGISPNVQDDEGHTPFHLLLICLKENHCKQFSMASTRELLKHGMNPYLPNEYGENAMQLLEENKGFYVGAANYLERNSYNILPIIHNFDLNLED